MKKRVRKWLPMVSIAWHDKLKICLKYLKQLFSVPRLITKKIPCLSSFGLVVTFCLTILKSDSGTVKKLFVFFADVKSYLMQQLDVFISVREKPRQSCISVIVKSIEQNAHCVYQARDQLLQALTKGEVDGKMSPVRFDGSVSWRDPDDSSACFEDSFNAVSHFSQSQRRQESLNGTEIKDIAAAVKPSSRKMSETISKYNQVQKQPSSQIHPVVSPFADYTEKKQKATKGTCVYTMYVHD